MSDSYNEIIESFKSAGQGHVFKFWDTLSDSEKSDFVRELKEVDLSEIDNLYKTLIAPKNAVSSYDYSKLIPADYKKLPADKKADAKWQEAYEVGRKAIKSGKLAAFVVAGGQGTRLGLDAPKGIFEISPIKHKSFFQIFAEKLLKAKKEYGVSIPWMIMTSHLNDADTREFFEKHDFFGLDKKDVFFFKQGRMPALTKEGKLLLRSKNSLAMIPDGHGGCLRAMSRSGTLAELRKRGIEYISYFQVDNPLVNIIDPYFVGFHILAKSQMSSKMIKKGYALEKVGHFCMYEGKLHVVEYSDLPKDYQEMQNADGSLKFDAGSVAIHVLDLDFADNLGGFSDFSLPFHRADKKVEFADENGVPTKPESPNAIKLEMFVFDALPMAKNPVVIEGSRLQEFSAVKNAQGNDTPETCRRDMKKCFASWFEKCGVVFEKGEDGAPLVDLEISPLFASNEEEFVRDFKSLYLE